MIKTTIHRYIKHPGIYAIYDRDLKVYVKSTNKAAENGVIVLIDGSTL